MWHIGEEFVYWFGTKPTLNVRNPELIQEILSNKLGHYEPPPFDPYSSQVARERLLGLKGEKWSKHRRIIAPAFHLDPLKVKEKKVEFLYIVEFLYSKLAPLASNLLSWNETCSFGEVLPEVFCKFSNSISMSPYPSLNQLFLIQCPWVHTHHWINCSQVTDSSFSSKKVQSLHIDKVHAPMFWRNDRNGRLGLFKVVSFIDW